MKFTPLEIMTINEIAGYRDLFGLPFHIETDDSDAFMNTLRSSLEEKGILKGETLSEIGVMMALLFEKYNTATKYIFVNRSRMAIDKDFVITFTKEKDEVEIIRKHKVKAIEDLVMNHEFLRGSSKKTFLISQPIVCSEESWMEEVLDNYPNFLMI